MNRVHKYKGRAVARPLCDISYLWGLVGVAVKRGEDKGVFFFEVEGRET